MKTPDPIVVAWHEICVAASFAQAQNEIAKAVLGHGIRQVALKLVMTVPAGGFATGGVVYNPRKDT